MSSPFDDAGDDAARRIEPPFDPDPVKTILSTAKRIAVVGWSADPSRTSARIARYLVSVGYEVLPINPTTAAVDGRHAYASLGEVPGPIDLVVVFRRSELARPHVDEAIATGARGVWLQLGVVCAGGAERARAAGLFYIEDACVMVEHQRRFGSASRPL